MDDVNQIKYKTLKTKEGLTDVWEKGKCLGKGLSDEEINNLYLK